MTISLTNSKTRRKEVFTPIDPKNVRMYVCGPTVYDRAHLGNARPAIVFDVLARLLRHVYGADHVTYVRNFTDVDDKINATAQARKAAGDPRSLEELIAERTEETIGWYLQDMGAVGVMEPDHMPRATQFIAQMVAMIDGLIADGHAYEAEGHVLFAVESYKDYGALSGRSVDDMIAGARVEVAPYKRNPMDFVLWKPSADDLPGWDSPWGRGRPGWHIECSAMAYELLGESFDIHGGGNDLMFPHHENEIAQSCCAHPHGDFAKVWLHNEMLQVEGKKMSKSLGNFFTVRDLLDGHDGMPAVPGEVIRFVMLSTHYRKPMDWTAKKREDAEKNIAVLTQALQISLDVDAQPTGKIEDVLDWVQTSLEDDLNTSGALSALQKQAKTLLSLANGRIDVQGEAKEVGVRDMAISFVTGLELLGMFDLLKGRLSSASSPDLSGLAEHLAGVRAKAMETKDFSEVDRLKTALIEAGVEVRMSKAGVELLPGAGFDAAKLEGLV
ncbi:cysteine--tRNA ligase [Alloyangia pacifica]|uniref:cysteine--tRNA ligase n=1 Tax=Alloyangia pacifica TaxID=311180 RepID=UPI001CD4FDDE|nr:cysteine--tRNA ligase [Alloyangia pacifica]MCA0995581.1 cysteine--tRNA ligase [Alloyangia pacifica]